MPLNKATKPNQSKKDTMDGEALLLEIWWGSVEYPFIAIISNSIQTRSSSTY